MNKVRSMLSESGLDQKFWAEAASTSVYVINRLPSSAIEFKIPEQMWTSALLDLSGLRRFVCIVYVHSDEGKLNPRSKRGVFTGYPEGVKGFRVWLLDEEKCVISINVIFREELMYKDINKTNSGNSVPLNIYLLMKIRVLRMQENMLQVMVIKRWRHSQMRNLCLVLNSHQASLLHLQLNKM